MLEVIERLESSEEFKKFKKEYPTSYICSVFFVLGQSPEERKRQINYALSESGSEVVSFDVSNTGRIFPQKLDTVKNEKLTRISKDDVQITMEEIAEKIEKEAKRKYDKIIGVLQDFNGTLIWNLTCIDGFTLHRYHIDAKTGKFEQMKDIKLQDMMRIDKKTPDYIQ